MPQIPGLVWDDEPRKIPGLKWDDEEEEKEPEIPWYHKWIGTGLEIGPSIAGSLIGGGAGLFGGGVGAIPGTMAGGAVGSAIGNTLRQGYEGYFGLRDEFNPWEVTASTVLGAAPPILGAGKLAAKAGLSGALKYGAKSALSGGVEGAIQGAAGVPIQKWAQTGDITPTWGEVGQGAVGGGLFGTAVGGALGTRTGVKHSRGLEAIANAGQTPPPADTPFGPSSTPFGPEPKPRISAAEFARMQAEKAAPAAPPPSAPTPPPVAPAAEVPFDEGKGFPVPKEKLTKPLVEQYFKDGWKLVQRGPNGEGIFKRFIREDEGSSDWMDWVTEWMIKRIRNRAGREATPADLTPDNIRQIHGKIPGEGEELPVIPDIEEVGMMDTETAKSFYDTTIDAVDYWDRRVKEFSDRNDLDGVDVAQEKLQEARTVAWELGKKTNATPPSGGIQPPRGMPRSSNEARSAGDDAYDRAIALRNDGDVTGANKVIEDEADYLNRAGFANEADSLRTDWADSNKNFFKPDPYAPYVPEQQGPSHEEMVNSLWERARELGINPENYRSVGELEDAVERATESGWEGADPFNRADPYGPQPDVIPLDKWDVDQDNTADPFGHITDPDAYDRAQNPDLYDPITGRPKRVPPIEGSLADRANKFGLREEDYATYDEFDAAVSAREQQEIESADYRARGGPNFQPKDFPVPRSEIERRQFEIERRYQNTGRAIDKYRLPDGSIVPVDATATKGEQTTDFGMRDGTTVKMEYVGPLEPGDTIDPSTGRVIQLRHPDDTAEDSGYDPNDPFAPKPSTVVPGETTGRVAPFQSKDERLLSQQEADLQSSFNVPISEWPDARLRMVLDDLTIEITDPNINEQQRISKSNEINEIRAEIQRRGIPNQGGPYGSEQNPSGLPSFLNPPDMEIPTGSERIPFRSSESPHTIRANEEIEEAGSLAQAIVNVKAQIAEPVNAEHQQFMQQVLSILETQSSSGPIHEGAPTVQDFERWMAENPTEPIHPDQLQAFNQEQFGGIPPQGPGDIAIPSGGGIEVGPLRAPGILGGGIPGQQMLGPRGEADISIDAPVPPMRGQQELPLGPVGETPYREYPEDAMFAHQNHPTIMDPRPTPHWAAPEDAYLPEIGDAMVNRYLKKEDAIPPEMNDIVMPPESGTPGEAENAPLIDWDGLKKGPKELFKGMSERLTHHTAKSWAAIVEELDAENAPDYKYHDIMSTAGKVSLRKGQTWRNKVIDGINYFESTVRPDTAEDSGVPPEMAGGGAPPPRRPVPPNEGPPVPPDEPFNIDEYLREQEAANKTPKWREWYNLARGLTTTLDFSAPLRQGLPLIFSKAWRKSWAYMMKAYGSEGAYQKTLADIRSRPLFSAHRNETTGKVTKSWADKAGLRIMDLSEDVAGTLTRREEGLAGNWVESGGMVAKIPGAQAAYKATLGRGARASNRAYTAFLNQLRADTFETLMKAAKSDFDAGLAGSRNPYTDLPYAQEIAAYVNTATGRGPLKTHIGSKEVSLEQHAKLLTDIIFSPRLMASRVRMLNPSTYMMASPFVRKQYLNSLFQTAGAWSTFAGVAYMAGAEVSLDPESADFGKIKIGNTRLDPAGGFQQYLVSATRLVTGHKRSSGTSSERQELGQGYRADTRKDVIERFGVNKLHPVLKFAYDMLNASEYTPFQVGDRTAQLFVPLIMQDVWELAKTDPGLLPLVIPPVAIGMGTQTYEKGESISKFLPKEYDISFEGGNLWDSGEPTEEETYYPR